MIDVYNYAIKNGILATGAYTKGSCTRTANSKTVSSFVNVQRGNENALKEAVGTKGPVSVAIYAPKSFLYPTNTTGIYDDPNCIGQPNYAGGFSKITSF